MIHRLMDLFRQIPGAGKAIGWVVIVGTALVLSFMYFGLGPTIALAFCFVAIYAGAYLYRRMKARRERQQGLAFGKAVGGVAGPSREEMKLKVSELNTNMLTAMETLKNHDVDIYELPWYMLIGDSKSGKSTTLRSSGLSFPLGEVSYSGTGGTKNCDWWFTSSGVVLDTAGRFTIQDVGATDPHEWDRFLELLVKFRPYCPINGVILVIPADDLLREDRQTIEGKANAISERLTQIQRRLAICFPVYVMITKCDLIYGFTQFFDQLPPNQHVEMFGWSSPDEKPGFHKLAFDQAFENILMRIRHTRLKSLSQAHAAMPDKTFVFPEEFSSLQLPLECYLKSIFKGDVFKEPLLFRGFYFSSAAQEGHPIVKACGEMIRDSSVLQDLKELFHTTRAFFVRDFYTDKVFPEEGLVSRGKQFRGQDKRKRKILVGVNILLILVGVTFGAFMWRSLHNRLQTPKQAIGQAAKSLGGLDDDDFFDNRSRVHIYNTLNSLHHGVGAAQASGFNFGKGQHNALTRNMNDSFAVLYLDRFLLGMFDRVNQQLGDFRLYRPRKPPDSNGDLTKLCRALTELQEWRFRVASNSLASFEPEIEPFLELVLDPTWDEELKSQHVGQTLKENLAEWFKVAYPIISPEVRRFLITEMVQRGQNPNLFYGMHQKVANFYRDQPELANYKKKLRLLSQLQLAWSGLAAEPYTLDDYHELLDRLDSFFEPENQEQLEQGADDYLTLEDIRNRVVSSLGREYMNLDQPVDNAAEQAAKVFTTAVSRPLQNEVVDFVRSLATLRPYEDPRKQRQNEGGASEPLMFPEYIETFQRKILAPYNTQREQEESYHNLYLDKNRLDDNMEVLLVAASKRIRDITEVWQTQLESYFERYPQVNDGKQIKKACESFREQLMAAERKAVDEALSGLIAKEDTLLPRTNKTWSSFVAELGNFESDRFEPLFKMPKKVIRLLERDFDKELGVIYERATPEKEIDDYREAAKSALKQLHDKVVELDGLSEKILAADPKYAKGRFTGATQLRKIKGLTNVPAAMSRHHRDLRVWSAQAERLFKKHAMAADPCPECSTSMTSLVQAIERVGNGFPIRYNGQTTSEKVGLGQVEIKAKLAKPEELEELFEQIKSYRDLTLNQEEHLRGNGKYRHIQEAIAWADAVEKLIKGELEMSYKIEHSGSQGKRMPNKDLTEEFTFVIMEGGYQANRISLNSARFERITESEDASDLTVIRFKNEFSKGDAFAREESDSKVIIRQGLRGLLAWAFDGSKVTDRENQREKLLLLPLDQLSNEEVKGIFLMQTSEPLPPPPNWEKLKEI